MAGLGYVMGNVCKEAREGDWALNCMQDCPGLGSEKDSILNPGVSISHFWSSLYNG